MSKLAIPHDRIDLLTSKLAQLKKVSPFCYGFIVGAIDRGTPVNELPELISKSASLGEPTYLVWADAFEKLGIGPQLVDPNNPYPTRQQQEQLALDTTDPKLDEPPVPPSSSQPQTQQLQVRPQVRHQARQQVQRAQQQGPYTQSQSQMVHKARGQSAGQQTAQTVQQPQPQAPAVDKMAPHVLTRLHDDWLAAAGGRRQSEVQTIAAGPIGEQLAARYKGIRGYEWVTPQTTWNQLYPQSHYDHYRRQYALFDGRDKQHGAGRVAAMQGRTAREIDRAWTGTFRDNAIKHLREQLAPRLLYATPAQIGRYVQTLDNSQRATLRYALSDEMARLQADADQKQEAVTALGDAVNRHAPMIAQYGHIYDRRISLDHQLADINRRWATAQEAVRTAGTTQARQAAVAQEQQIAAQQQQVLQQRQQLDQVFQTSDEGARVYRAVSALGSVKDQLERYQTLFSELHHGADTAYGRHGQQTLRQDLAQQMQVGPNAGVDGIYERLARGTYNQRAAFLADTDYNTFRQRELDHVNGMEQQELAAARDDAARTAIRAKYTQQRSQIPNAQDYYRTRAVMLQQIESTRNWHPGAFKNEKWLNQYFEDPTRIESRVLDGYDYEYDRSARKVPRYRTVVHTTPGVANPYHRNMQYLYDRYIREGVAPGPNSGLAISSDGSIRGLHGIDRFAQANFGASLAPQWGSLTDEQRGFLADNMTQLQRGYTMNNLMQYARQQAEAGHYDEARQAQQAAQFLQQRFNKQLADARKLQGFDAAREFMGTRDYVMNGPGEHRDVIRQLPRPLVQAFADPGVEDFRRWRADNPVKLKYDPALGWEWVDRTALNMADVLSPVYRTGLRLYGVGHHLAGGGPLKDYYFSDTGDIRRILDGDFTAQIGPRDLGYGPGETLLDAGLTALTIVPGGSGARAAISGGRFLPQIAGGFLRNQALSGLRHAGVVIPTALATAGAQTAVEMNYKGDPVTRQRLRMLAGLTAGIGTGAGIQAALPQIQSNILRNASQLAAAQRSLADIERRIAQGTAAKQDVSALARQRDVLTGRIRELETEATRFRTLGGDSLSQAERVAVEAERRLAQARANVDAAGRSPSQAAAALQELQLANAAHQAAQRGLRDAYGNVDRILRDSRSGVAKGSPHSAELVAAREGMTDASLRREAARLMQSNSALTPQQALDQARQAATARLQAANQASALGSGQTGGGTVATGKPGSPTVAPQQPPAPVPATTPASTPAPAAASTTGRQLSQQVLEYNAAESARKLEGARRALDQARQRGAPPAQIAAIEKEVARHTRELAASRRALEQLIQQAPQTASPSVLQQWGKWLYDRSPFGENWANMGQTARQTLMPQDGQRFNPLAWVDYGVKRWNPLQSRWLGGNINHPLAGLGRWGLTRGTQYGLGRLLMYLRERNRADIGKNLGPWVNNALDYGMIGASIFSSTSPTFRYMIAPSLLTRMERSRLGRRHDLTPEEIDTRASTIGHFGMLGRAAPLYNLAHLLDLDLDLLTESVPTAWKSVRQTFDRPGTLDEWREFTPERQLWHLDVDPNDAESRAAVYARMREVEALVKGQLKGRGIDAAGAGKTLIKQLRSEGSARSRAHIRAVIGQMADRAKNPKAQQLARTVGEIQDQLGYLKQEGDIPAEVLRADTTLAELVRLRTEDPAAFRGRVEGLNSQLSIDMPRLEKLLGAEFRRDPLIAELRSRPWAYNTTDIKAALDDRNHALWRNLSDKGIRPDAYIRAVAEQPQEQQQTMAPATAPATAPAAGQQTETATLPTAAAAATTAQQGQPSAQVQPVAQQQPPAPVRGPKDLQGAIAQRLVTLKQELERAGEDATRQQIQKQINRNVVMYHYVSNAGDVAQQRFQQAGIDPSNQAQVQQYLARPEVRIEAAKMLLHDPSFKKKFADLNPEDALQVSLSIWDRMSPTHKYFLYGGLSLAAIGLLSSSMDVDDEEEDGKGKGRNRLGGMSRWGPLLGISGLAAAGYGATGGNPQQLLNKRFWSGALKSKADTA